MFALRKKPHLHAVEVLLLIHSHDGSLGHCSRRRQQGNATRNKPRLKTNENADSVLSYMRQGMQTHIDSVVEEHSRWFLASLSYPEHTRGYSHENPKIHKLPSIHKAGSTTILANRPIVLSKATSDPNSTFLTVLRGKKARSATHISVRPQPLWHHRPRQ